MHDFGAGTPFRRFLERHFPEAFFSDHPEFIERFGYLDQGDPTGKPWDSPRETAFACLPPTSKFRPFWIWSLRIAFARAISLIPAKAAKKLGWIVRGWDSAKRKSAWITSRQN
jgi:hypothetical protein